MNQEFFFPVIDWPKLLLAISLYKQNGDSYLNHPNCTYPPELKELIRGKVSDNPRTNVEVASDKEAKLPTSDELLNNLSSLASLLEEFGQTIKNNSQDITPAERNTYFRVSIGLIEKLVSMREKVSKVKEYENFTRQVVEIFDKHLTKDQRSVIIGQLKEYM